MVDLAHSLGQIANSVFHPGAKLVVDETIIEFEGKCPYTRCIPRKPHPIGFVVFTLAANVFVGAHAIPIVLDHEPYIEGNLVTPQSAMMRLLKRFEERHPAIHPHLYVDSAFGSFSKMNEIVELGYHLLY